MWAKIGQQQVENLNLFTQKLANLLNKFLNRLEEANKGKSISVTDAETSKYSCSKIIANNEILKVLSPRPLPIMEMRTIKRRQISTSYL